MEARQAMTCCCNSRLTSWAFRLCARQLPSGRTSHKMEGSFIPRESVGALDSGRGAALQKFSLTGTAEKVFVLNQHTPAREHDICHTLHFDSFEHRIVHTHVVGFGADGVLAVGIEDHEISVA